LDAAREIGLLAAVVVLTVELVAVWETPGGSHGHHDGKSRTLAQGRDQVDGMAEQDAQAVDDGEAEAETALGIASSEAVEFAEDIPPLVFGNPRPAVPDFDMHRVTAPPATHDDAAGGGITFGSLVPFVV